MFKQFAVSIGCILFGAVALAMQSRNEVVGDTSSAGTEGKSGAQAESESSTKEAKPAFHLWAIRYQIKDVDRAIAFYTQQLGFKLEQQQGTAFARISNGNLSVLLSGPQSSGSRALPDGRRQEPGGWNRIVLQVDDLPSIVAKMKQEGFNFRNQIETGPGGKQIQLEDPDGNPIELFEPASKH